MCAGPGQKQITFNQVPLDQRDRICRRGCRRHAAAVACASSTRLPFEKVTRVYEMVDRPMVAVDRRGWSATASRSTARCCKACRPSSTHQIAALEEQICGEAGCTFTIGSPQQLGDILFDQMGLSGRAQGQVRHLVDRRHRARAAVARGRADRPAGARLAPAHQAQIDLYRRAAGADQPGDRPRPHLLLACRARRPGGSPRPTPICMNIPIRTEIGRRIRDAFIAEPGHRHARRPTTARSNCGSPPIWPTCRSCARRSRAATTSTT